MSTRARGWSSNRERPALRGLQLLAGLALFGVSVALMIEADLGVDPWDVLHQGIARQIGSSVGTVVVATSVVVLLLWIPLRQRPGIGTVANALLVGVALDLALVALPRPDLMAGRLGFLGAGILLNGVATGMYIGAALGPGPRDGLMTGLAARGYSIRAARTSIEVLVLAAGWLLGGTVGVGTVLYALSIGPLAYVLIPFFAIVPPKARKDVDVTCPA